MPEATTTEPPSISLYSGNLISELVTNRAFSALLLGERRSGTSALLRAILFDRITKPDGTLIEVLDFHSGEWGGLEDVQLDDGSRLVSFLPVTTQTDLAPVARRLATVAAEIKRRQQQLRTDNLALSPEPMSPYLFLLDGLSELHGALPGWTADRRSKHVDFSRCASHLRFILCHGPAVGVTCVATARSHTSCLCDATALGETWLLFLGRVSQGRNGGYRAIDRAIEDRALLPSPHERSRFREALSALKPQRMPLVFTPNGVPRLGALGNFSSYLRADLLVQYQLAVEGTP